LPPVPGRRTIAGSVPDMSALTVKDVGCMIDRDRFRDALAAWASGVTVVACRNDERVIATTVSSFMSLSLDPPLILAAIGPNATVRPFLVPGQAFAVSILSSAQRRLAMVFADPLPVGADPFPSDGAPVVEGCLLGLECVVERVDDGGDHAIVIASVRDAVRGAGVPLIRYNRGYHVLDG
ncbi:MAG: flavin reductase family protein, partial [Gemmatimonadetes bacterium]|nr:flavin reductase family protein [Gemmatimonadota bacterium]